MKCRKCKKEFSVLDIENHEENCNSDSGDFGTSMLIGAVTGSALIGGLLGGDMAGGIIGDMLDGDLFD